MNATPRLPLDGEVIEHLKAEPTESTEKVRRDLPQPVADAIKRAVEEREDDEDWLWWSKNPELVVVPEQPETAIYKNVAGAIVIRQRAQWNEDVDPLVFITRDNVKAVIDRLMQFEQTGE
jgi:hypothetical protein